MKRRTFLLSAAATLAAPAIRAQAAWPMGQPIRVIVPYPAGAANDAMGRLAAQRLQDKLGATVVVENRAGGSATIGTTAVLNAAPDGYTILASAFNHIIMNHAVKGVSFDPQADFETIGRTARAPLLMVMSPKMPQKTVAEVIAAAKAAPNDWTFALPALGAPSHLATVDFMSRTGVNIATTPYRGTAPALTDVVGGHVQLLIDASFALLPAAKEGTRQGARHHDEGPFAARAGHSDARRAGPCGLRLPVLVRVVGAEGHAARDLPAHQRTDARDDAGAGRSCSGSTPRCSSRWSRPARRRKAYIAAEVPKHVALLKKAGFEAQ